jgi:hypothetical protein
VSAFAFAAAAKGSSAASGLTIVFLTFAAFLIGGAISFGMRKRWVGVSITTALAVGSCLVALSYYRAYKGL